MTSLVDATELSPETILERLDGWPVARLATVGRDDRPHLVPIVFARVGESLYSPVDGKPKSGRTLARVRNIGERPAVSMLLDEYTEDWRRLWWIRVDAHASVANLPAGDATRNAAVAALRDKYPQYRDVSLLDPLATLLELRIERIRSWCAIVGSG